VGPWLVALVVIVALLSLPSPFLTRLVTTPALAATTPTHLTWNVTAGASPGPGDQSIQGMAFYPGVITINQYDKIVWKLGSFEPHTISFTSGAVPPEPDLPISIKPAGGSTYNGTGFVSSGVIFPSQSYTLNFTAPGVYEYYCLSHVGMNGIVVVNPAGTAYPFTQANYNQQAKAEEQADIAAENAAVKYYQPYVEPGPNGTTIYVVGASLSPLLVNVTYTSSGIPNFNVLPPSGPEAVTVPVAGLNGASYGGLATITLTKPGAIQVSLNIKGLSPSAAYSAQLRLGTCSEQGKVLYALRDVAANAKGVGTSSTSISDNVMSIPNIPEVGWFIQVYQGQGPAGATTPSACGNVSFPTVALMRFVPATFTIKAGDSVKWVEHSPSDEHDITFTLASAVNTDKPVAAGDISAAVPPGSPAEAGGLFILDAGGEDVKAAGNGTRFNSTGFFSSGLLSLGQSYMLTFPNAGNYQYVCQPHDALGMIGFLNVLPATGAVSAAEEGFTTVVHSTTSSQSSASPSASQQPASIPTVYLGVLAALVLVAVIGFAMMRRRQQAAPPPS